MATTENFHTGGSGVTTFGFSFPILQNSDLKVELDGVLKTENTSGTNNDYSISNTNVVFNTAPTSGVDIHFYRVTDVDTVAPVFVSGSAIRAQDLNSIADKTFYSNQEQQQKIKTSDVRDKAITSAKILDGTIVNTDINASANIDNSKIADGLLKSGLTINSSNIVNGSIVNDDVSNSANISGSKLADDSVTLTKLGSGALPTDITVSRDNIVNGTIQSGDIETGTFDSRYYTETELDAGQLDNRYYTETELNAGQLDNRYYTETELNAGQLDNRYYTETEADARFYNLASAEEIQSGETWTAADNKVATTAAIDARIIDLVDDVGGFVPIASETNFPTANPDVNNGTGTLVSIKSIGTTRTPSSGTVTIANGAGSGNTVTITGCGSTVLTAGFGVIVETTSTLHTYTFHRLTPKATEVTAVAGKATEIGRLGTADAVADMAILGTADVVADLNTLGTADVVADMNMLATSDVVADMNMLAVSDVISDMNDLATSANITAMSNCSGSIASINNASSNLNSINNFGDTYQVANSNPSTDGGGNQLAEGDLYFNTSANRLKVYDGANWVNGVEISSSGAVTTGNTFTGDNKYNDNVKLLVGTGSDLEIFHNTNDSIINDAGQGNLKLQTGGTTKLEVTSAGVTVTGQVTSNTLQLSSNAPRIIFTDLNNNPDFEISGNSGALTFIDSTNGANRLIIQSDGTLDVQGNLDANGGLDVTGNITVTGTVDGVDIAALNTTVGNITTDVVTDTTPQLGGNLDTNGKNIEFKNSANNATKVLFNAAQDELEFADGAGLTFGDQPDVALSYSNGNDFSISGQYGGSGDIVTGFKNVSGTILKAIKAVRSSQAVELYHDNSKKLETMSWGTQIYGALATTGNLDCATDSYKIKAGAGGDIELYHNGTHSYLANLTGNLFVEIPESQKFQVQHGSEAIINGYADGRVELYYDNSKKFETTSAGVAVTGGLTATSHITLPDDVRLKVGTGEDLHIYHNQSNSVIREEGTGNLNIQTTGGNVEILTNTTETSAKFISNGAVELYYDNSKKFETHSAGVSVLGNLNLYDNNVAKWGNNSDLQIYHDGGANYIQGDSHNTYIWSNGAALKAIPDGAVELYYDNSKKLETRSNGVTVTGSIITSSYGQLGYYSGLFGKIRVGADVYGNTIKTAGDANLNITANNSVAFNLSANTDGSDAGTSVAIFTIDGLRPTSNNARDLGTTTYRWRNIYTNDLNLSNEGSSNDMDGSWGNWTIQEGESDLFLKNNRSGKKYKFNLTEVS